MKKQADRKTQAKKVLAASCIVILLWGCAGNEKKTNELKIEPIVAEEDVQSTPGADTQTVPENDTPTEDPSIASAKDIQPSSDDTQETVSDSQTLYEQFLNDNIPAAVDGSYSEGDYANQILEKDNILTLTELETRVSNYFFDPEYTDKTACDQIQYAYIGCPDSTDENDKNLLIKFVGLNIYTQDDDSYAVFILTENNGQLYITGSYECWARSETTARANGILSDSGSSGAGDHGAGLAVILSNGKRTSIYNAEILSGWWTSYVNESIYNEIIDENTVPPELVVSIYTIGDKKYYQYDMTYCAEEEKPLCEDYINRCRDEASINWVSETEIQTAIQNQCTAVGIDYAIIDQQEEAVWNKLP